MQVPNHSHTHTHTYFTLCNFSMEKMIAENYAALSLEEVEREDEEEEPKRLSFSHLPSPQNNSGSSSTPSARPDLLFEFSAADLAAAPTHSYHNDIVFCGKIIHDDDEEEEDELNEYQKRDYFATVKSKSLRKPSSPDSEHRRLSAATRFSGELARPKSADVDVDYHVQRVNISSLTSMSAKSRRRMFMFGPVKFKPEMELGAIKQRQAKLAESGRKGQWEMLKSSLSGRSHLTSLFARSLGCIPAVRGGDRRLGAAN
ncbi:uncharacterized protein LOC131014865 [Salvia miltiorrhiza]|uniref:uncharacterized protein LOC131014865 n=1 Tax=Salvia miltiorrhiza TaxID=226208 RepID=UPI0025ABCBD9|nr:uncharacterized protein LOC131014865 [Salvia miltiorrhiza]